MSRKRSREALRSYWKAFRDGAARNGVTEEIAQKIFKQVVAFSEFGFPKSHAAAFGLLAYQSAWLRHYYPTEYYVALFNNQPMGFYSLDALVRDAKRNGLRVHLPDLNRSEVACTAEEQDLRVGLGFVRGWSGEVAEQVIQEREARGPFRSLPDFLRRTNSGLKRPVIENLIWVGGMDSLGLSRRESIWQTGLWLGPETDHKRIVERENHPQLGLQLDDPFANLRFRQIGDQDRLLAEYRMLRFSTALHPLTFVESALPTERVLANELPHLRQNATVTVAGVVVARQRPQTAKGYTFVLMEDEDGPINVIVKPELYERERSVVRMEPFLLVRGRLRKDGATLNVIAYSLQSLRSAENPGSQSIDAPPTLEYWGNASSTLPPTRFLTALRQTPPGIKSFG